MWGILGSFFCVGFWGILSGESFIGILEHSEMYNHLIIDVHIILFEKMILKLFVTNNEQN